MKRAGFLFPYLISDYNIDLAITTCIKNKKSKRKKRRDAQDVLNSRVKYIRIIKEKIINNDFTKPVYKIFKRYDTSSQKERLIIEPDIIFQIIQYAIIQTADFVLMRGLTPCSYGNIPKRGLIYGKRKIEKFIKENQKDCRYCLKADIRHFFQSVDTDLLFNKILRVIKDKQFLDVIKTTLNANTGIYNGEIMKMGLPIGYFIAQKLAEFFMLDFDHFVIEKLHPKFYGRNVDDFTIFHNNKKELHNMFDAIREFLKGKNLEIKDNWQIFKFDYINKQGKRIGRPLDMLGYKFYRDKTVLRKKNMLKTTRKARKIAKKKNVSWYEASQLVSNLGMMKHCDCHNVYEKHIRPFTNITTCKKVISEHSKKRSKT